MNQTNKIKLIHKWRKLFRNHIDNLVIFVGWSKDNWYKEYPTFKYITDKAYLIDNTLEYFIRNGNKKSRN